MPHDSYSMSSLARATGTSRVTLRELVRTGVLVPIGRGPRGALLFDPAAAASAGLTIRNNPADDESLDLAARGLVRDVVQIEVAEVLLRLDEISARHDAIDAHVASPDVEGQLMCQMCAKRSGLASRFWWAFLRRCRTMLAHARARRS